MNESVELRQQMWDLVYGLLEAEERDAFHARIKSDPQAARLYAEVRLQADLVAQAAKVGDVSVSLPEVEPRRVQPAVAARAPSRAAGPLRTPLSQRGLQWLAGIAASALAALIAVGLFWPIGVGTSSPQTFLVMHVDAPMAAQSEQRVEFETLNVATRRGQSETVTYRVTTAKGVQFEQVATTDETGKGELVLPADGVTPGATLEVYHGYQTGLSREVDEQARNAQAKTNSPESRSTDGGERPIALWSEKLAEQPALVANLQVHEPVRTQLRLDKELYAQGETALFRAQHYGAISYDTSAAPQTRYYLISPNGDTSLAAIDTTRADGGVVTGKIPIPETAPSGLYKIAVDNPSFGKREEVGDVVIGQEFLGRRKLDQDGGNAEALTLAIGDTRDSTDKAPSRAAADGAEKSAVKGRQPDSSKLAASGAPRSPLPAPALPREAGAAPGGASAPPAPAEGTPVPAEPAIESFAGAGKSAESLDRMRKAQVAARNSLAEAGEVIDVTVPQSAAGKPLTVTAAVGDRIVALQTLPAELSAKKEGEDQKQAKDDKLLAAFEKKARLQLAPDVVGEDITVSILDDSASPPKLVKQEVLQRQSRRRVNVHFSELRDQYAPEEPVRFVVQVTDVEGRPLPHATLGLVVSEFDGLLAENLLATARATRFGFEAAERLAQAERKHDLTRSALGMGGKAGTDGREAMPLPPPGQVESSSKPAPVDSLAGQDAQSAPAAAAPPLAEPAPVAGIQTDELKAAAPVSKVVFSNESEVQAAFDRERAELAARHLAFRWNLGKALLVGAIVVVGLVVVLSWVQRGMPRMLWAPLLGIAAASLLVGFVWMLGNYRQSADLSVAQGLGEGEHAAPASAMLDDAPPASPGTAATDRPEGLNEAAPLPRVFAGDMPAAEGAGGLPSAAPGLGGGGFGARGERETDAKQNFGHELARGGAMGAEGPKALADKESAEGIREKLGSSDSPEKGARGLKGEIRAKSETRFKREGESPPREGKETGKEEAKAAVAASLAKSLEEQSKPQDEAGRADRGPKMAAGLELRQQSGTRTLASGRASRSKASGVWQPVLTTDENGQAIIEFTMPEGEGDYRLVLDVQGSGRVGSLETLLRCEAPKPASVPPAANAKPNP